MTIESSQAETGRRIGYARVSTAEQSTFLQQDALLASGCDPLFIDNDASGATRNRPALAEAMNAVGQGDIIVVWKLDRLARSLQDLIDIVTELRGRGAHFESLTEKIDTISAHGEFVFHIIGAIAHMERRLIGERTVAGMEAARRRGAKLGRPRKLDEARARTAYRLITEENANIDDLAARWDIAPITVTRALKRYGLEA